MDKLNSKGKNSIQTVGLDSLLDSKLRIRTKQELNRFHKRFVSGNQDIKKLIGPVTSENGSDYAFEGCDEAGNRAIIVNGKIKVKYKIDKTNFIFFLKGSSTPVAEFIGKEVDIGFGRYVKNALCCLVGDTIMGPLDAIKTYKYNDLGDGTFEVLYINQKMNPMRAVISKEGKELEDKSISIEDMQGKYGIFD